MTLLFSFIALCGVASYGAQAEGGGAVGKPPDVILVGRFDKDAVGNGPPAGWQEQTFSPKKVPRPSVYDVVRDPEEGNVLRARTESGASALYKRLVIDPPEYPCVVWRWRVDQLFDKGDERHKDGDDYPARLYIGFRYDPAKVGWLERRRFWLAREMSADGRYPPMYVLDYVWAHGLKANTWIANPWQDRAKMIAVRSGRAGLGKWHTEVRNYYEDYKAIIQAEPSPVELVAVMIDGDNTNSSGVSYFGEIKFLRKLPPDLAGVNLQPPTLDAR